MSINLAQLNPISLIQLLSTTNTAFQHLQTNGTIVKLEQLYADAQAEMADPHFAALVASLEHFKPEDIGNDLAALEALVALAQERNAFPHVVALFGAVKSELSNPNIIAFESALQKYLPKATPAAPAK